MTPLKVASTLLTGLVWATSASSFDDGHELLDALAIGVEAGHYTEDQWEKRLQFYGYMQGFVGSYRIVQLTSGAPDARLFCVTDEHTLGDITAAVERFVSHVSVFGHEDWKPDEFLNLPASGVVLAALIVGFPCS